MTAFWMQTAVIGPPVTTFWMQTAVIGGWESG